MPFFAVQDIGMNSIVRLNSYPRFAASTSHFTLFLNAGHTYTEDANRTCFLYSSTSSSRFLQDVETYHHAHQ